MALHQLAQRDLSRSHPRAIHQRVFMTKSDGKKDRLQIEMDFWDGL